MQNKNIMIFAKLYNYFTFNHG